MWKNQGFIIKLQIKIYFQFNINFYLRNMKIQPLPVQELIAEFRAQLVPQYDYQEVMNFLYLLFDAWKGWTKAKVHIESAYVLTKDEVTRFTEAMNQLKKNNPVQYIIGETWFHGLRLKVSPDVLIPRPETEELVSVAEQDIRKKKFKELSILDLCTGSGCIAISLKKIFPFAKVTALDISSGALQIARENALSNNCDIGFLQGDILDENINSNLQDYHIIISNPPYVKESEKKFMKKNVLEYEPPIALFVPDEDPLKFYKAIADLALIRLISPGKLYVEINEFLAGDIRRLLLAKGFHNVEIVHDIHHKCRFAIAER
jgi:release factor glutamine methyltransferase